MENAASEANSKPYAKRVEKAVGLLFANPRLAVGPDTYQVA
jgi:hypothetical protein